MRLQILGLVVGITAVAAAATGALGVSGDTRAIASPPRTAEVGAQANCSMAAALQVGKPFFFDPACQADQPGAVRLVHRAWQRCDGDRVHLPDLLAGPALDGLPVRRRALDARTRPALLPHSSAASGRLRHPRGGGGASPRRLALLPERRHQGSHLELGRHAPRRRAVEAAEAADRPTASTGGHALVTRFRSPSGNIICAAYSRGTRPSSSAGSRPD